MLLVIDVGNTNTVLGVYEGETLLHHWRVWTDREKTSDEYGILVRNLYDGSGFSSREVTAIIISSVVPLMFLITVTASLGSATYPEDAATPGDLVRAADEHQRGPRHVGVLGQEGREGHEVGEAQLVVEAEAFFTQTNTEKRAWHITSAALTPNWSQPAPVK